VPPKYINASLGVDSQAVFSTAQRETGDPLKGFLSSLMLDLGQSLTLLGRYYIVTIHGLICSVALMLRPYAINQFSDVHSRLCCDFHLRQAVLSIV
jgi:hypothetical protein